VILDTHARPAGTVAHALGPHPLRIPLWLSEQVKPAAHSTAVAQFCHSNRETQLRLRTQVKPEAQSYYELGAATLKFTFPEPAPLDGVTSRQKSILNMKKVGGRKQ